MSTALKSEIAETIETEIQPQADALEQSAAEQKTKIQERVNKLSEAIRSGNQALPGDTDRRDRASGQRLQVREIDDGEGQRRLG